MRFAEIETQLQAMFSARPDRGRNRHVVFWYDEKGEFEDYVADLNLGSVRLLRLSGRNNYQTKRTLEVEDTVSNFLVYSPRARPAPVDNWLLDIELYSDHYRADRLAIIMRDLGIDSLELRPVVEKYSRFFGNKERIDRFRALGITEYSERSIEIGIMSALTRQKVADINAVFRALLCDGSADAIVGVAGSEIVERYARSEYSYSSPEFDMDTFRIMVFVSALAHQARLALPRSWSGLVSSRKANCYVLVDGLARQPETRNQYDEMADWVSAAIGISSYIEEWDPRDYAGCGVFREFDIAIIRRIIDGLVTQVDTFDYWTELMDKRRTTRWYSEFRHIYQAIGQAVAVARLQQEWKANFAKGDALALFDAYTQRYFLMDQAYRKFYVAYDKARKPELLKEIRNRVEGIYRNWFLQDIGMAWSDAIQQDLAGWQRLDSRIDQQDMFFAGVESHLVRDGRVFVVISDALRYEAAEELATRLRREFSGDTELRPVQGVLPGITSLGMAALLPHRSSLTIGEGGSGIVNGQPTEGLDRRQALLAESGYAAKAILLKDTIAMTTDEMRAAFEGIRLVYIYHDRIDDTGHRRNEWEVFHAVDDAIDEIVDVVRALRNKVSATNIYITADHGFVYTRDPLDESDKVSPVSGAVCDFDKRYALARVPVVGDGVDSVKLRHKSVDGADLYLVTPRGYARFKKQGLGINYMHGGTSLQEIVVPKIWHRNDKTGKQTAIKVNLDVRASANRVTNRVFTLEFLQEQPVGGAWLPRKIVARFEDADGRPISDEVVVIADRKSQDRNERLFRERFTLVGTDFDKNADYYLVLEDPEERIDKVMRKLGFKIDLSIMPGVEFS